MDHLYVSTACLHSRHGECRRECKFCGAACLCPCHTGARVRRRRPPRERPPKPDPPTREELFTTG